MLWIWIRIQIQWGPWICIRIRISASPVFFSIFYHQSSTDPGPDPYPDPKSLEMLDRIRIHWIQVHNSDNTTIMNETLYYGTSGYGSVKSILKNENKKLPKDE